MNFFAKKEIVSYQELIELLDVSHMTVRRDVSILEKNNRINLVQGGISLIQSLLTEPSHLVKLSLNRTEKVEIGKIAVKQIPDNFPVLFILTVV